MKINFTLINEFFSFFFFFLFSYKKIFPIFLKNINKNNFYYFKNIILIKYFKTIKNKIDIYFFEKELKIKKNIFFYLKKINDVLNIEKKKIFFLIENEKKFLKKKILLILKNFNIKNINNFLKKIKISFLISFKKIFKEIILYNKEFIINYD
ncbi:F0F1-type ATP synthase B subunit [Candidatus Carsonella ruddii CS isolate Thao2000]|uniref:F0F1-type ATP synthase B subunit n=1 Tax=Candidatus Carsonella ruddii CS isolate Thao2000 TaxID=1202537 RepID=J7H058_CARRU|nr:hypothetical protein [Candidatus Carsonella ruddii]AFP83670.1 F0F1-type ATP synthase B subunit [Candidatus Carsonella ruddii CS isolate Thao2000]